jgi:hypothetical protein
MKKITLLIFVLSTFWANSQNQPIDFDKDIKPLNQKIESLKFENGKLKNQITTLSNDLLNTNRSLDSLRIQTIANSNEINKTGKDLDSKITTTETNANNKISAVDESLSKNSLYGIIGVLAAVLLSGLLYWLLSKRQKSDKTDVEGQLSQTKKTIEEEQIQINTKLAELYNGQMELLKTERKANHNNGEIDHSLPLKVADEIVKMQMNLVHMDNKIRGHKQLSIAVTNVFDNFKANGYEIIDHLNKPYNEGMNMDASKEPDPLLKEGEQIIKRIIKPEIHFNNKMIQKAQVIVSYGE